MLFDSFKCNNILLPDSFIVGIKSNFLHVSNISVVNLEPFDMYFGISDWPTLLAILKLVCIFFELV